MNIQDIAKIAGVSATTVSKVMNGKDKDISDKTRQRVLQVIEEQKYTPYFKFREKEGLKTRFIGLIIKRNNRERENIVLAAERAAREKNYSLIACYVENDTEIEKRVEELWQNKVAGILIDSEKNFTNTYFENTSIYLIQTKQTEEKQKVIFYYQLSEVGSLAAEKLIREGHEKIACLYMDTESEIYTGYEQSMHNAGLQVQPMWQYEAHSLGDIEQYGVRQCLSEKVTAIVCGSPEIAVCVSKVMERTRTSVPDEISLISIGDSKVLQILEKGITSVCLPAESIGHDAVDYLIGMIRGEKKFRMMRKFVPGVLERNSIGKPAREKIGEKIVVVGSMNMDITIEVSRIPVDGETQLAEKLYIFPGGKGGNQAVGAGKLGGQVYMIGCLGNDLDGKQLYTSLSENHVHMDGVYFDSASSTGKAYINVDKRNGESTIVVYQGANQNLSIDHINQCRYLFKSEVKRILVIGSLNMDIVMKTSHIPRPGETVCGGNIMTSPGGKGANQAYAAGRLGGNVGMIGAVGEDDYGRELKKNLESADVDTSGIETVRNGTTGQAYIAVDERGENSIIIIAGTNSLVTEDLVKKNIEAIKRSDIIMLQLEIPIETVKYVKNIADELGKLVILDPAPALPDLPDDFWKNIDYIKPNETELEMIVGESMNTLEKMKQGARTMLSKGVKNVIVTLGGNGCLLVSRQKERYFPANRVTAVDTTAAGDSFTAGFAVALSQGKTCEDAIIFGQKVSAIVVSRKGAQSSIPKLEEVL